MRKAYAGKWPGFERTKDLLRELHKGDCTR
jgi:hypothetical protein